MNDAIHCLVHNINIGVCLCVIIHITPRPAVESILITIFTRL